MIVAILARTSILHIRVTGEFDLPAASDLRQKLGQAANRARIFPTFHREKSAAFDRRQSWQTARVGGLSYVRQFFKFNAAYLSFIQVCCHLQLCIMKGM